MSGHTRLLTSVRNPLVVEVAKLHDARTRRALRKSVVEGPHQLADVLAAGGEVERVFHLEADRDGAAAAVQAGVPATSVSSAVLRRIAGTENPRGPVGVVAIPAPDPLESVDTVVLWEIRDPGNAGTIIRTAAALGYAVAVTPDTVDVWSPKVIRAAAATQFGLRMSVLPDSDLATLEAVGLHTVATLAAGGADPVDLRLRHPLALLVGNEAHGLPAHVAAGAHSAVTIPLEGGVESLNAAVAAALAMYALRRSAV